MSWILKDTINGTKIYQWDTNYATRNGWGSGPMDLTDKEIVMHNPGSVNYSDNPNRDAREYAESIVNKLKNYEAVVMTQGASGTDCVYLIQPLNYSCPAVGDEYYNNNSASIEVFCEKSKDLMKKGHKAFYDATVYANKLYGAKIGSHILHQEISATACPAKSVQYFGSVQKVKDDINSNSKTVKYYLEIIRDASDLGYRYYNPESYLDFKVVNDTYVFRSKDLNDKYPDTKKALVGDKPFRGLKYAGKTQEGGYTYYWEEGLNQHGNTYYVVYKKVKN